ncbi:MAG: hypothetical protein ACPLPR_02020 [Bacillota bacterium]
MTEKEKGLPNKAFWSRALLVLAALVVLGVCANKAWNEFTTVKSLEAELKARQEELAKRRNQSRDTGIGDAVAEAYAKVRSDTVVPRLVQVVEQVPGTVRLTGLKWVRGDGKDDTVTISGTFQKADELTSYLGTLGGVRSLKVITGKDMRFDAQVSAAPSGTGGKQ